MLGLSQIQMYVSIGAVALMLGTVGSLWLINHGLNNDVDELNGKLSTANALIIIKETENQTLNAEITFQNGEVDKFKKASNDFELKLADQKFIIDGIAQQGEIELVEIDGQFVEKTNSGAMRWMLEKAISGELK